MKLLFAAYVVSGVECEISHLLHIVLKLLRKTAVHLFQCVDEIILLKRPI